MSGEIDKTITWQPSYMLYFADGTFYTAKPENDIEWQFLQKIMNGRKPIPKVARVVEDVAVYEKAT